MLLTLTLDHWSSLVAKPLPDRKGYRPRDPAQACSSRVRLQGSPDRRFAVHVPRRPLLTLVRVLPFVGRKKSDTQGQWEHRNMAPWRRPDPAERSGKQSRWNTATACRESYK